ncbi:MAG: glutamate--tRNA ligase, partial [Chlorobi bacterium]|nr:glutamate--tRNA ligase [Chlorobiota bacterium]
ISDERLLLIIEAMRERVSFVKEFIYNCKYFYERPTEYDEKTVKKRWKEDSPKFLKALAERFEKLENPTKEDFEHTLKSLAEELEVGLGKLIHPARLAVSGTGAGPGLFDVLFILGKEEVLERIKIALEKLPN